MRVPVLAITIFLLATGCSSTPKKSDAESTATKFIKEKVPEIDMELSNFEHADGMRSNINGVDTYEYDFTIDIKFVDGFFPQCVDDPQNGQNANSYGCYQARGRLFKPIPVGEKIRVGGQVNFIKKESGWIAQDSRVTSATTCGALDTLCPS